MCLRWMWRDVIGGGYGGMCFGWLWMDVFGVGVDGCVLGGCGGMYLGWVLMNVFWVAVEGCILGGCGWMCLGGSGCTITISESALKVDLGRVLLHQGIEPPSVLCQDFWSDAQPVELSFPFIW